MDPTSGLLPIWTRVTRGLEWIAAAEASLISTVQQIVTKDRDLLFRCNKMATANQLRCIDDAFLIWGKLKGIGHTRLDLKQLDKLLAQLPNIPVEIHPQIKSLRVTASFLGKHNYSRYELEEVVGQALAHKFRLQFVDSRNQETTHALWVRLHLTGNEGLVGIRTTRHPCHRRLWRTEGLAGALHPPVAAAIALLADLQPHHTVVDPFVSSGTLLIEAGIQCPSLNLIGCDISENAINRAYTQGACSKIPLTLITADAHSASLPKADRIISNPPWGKAISLKGQVNNKNLIKALLNNLKPSGRCVLVMNQEARFSEQLKKSIWPPLLVHTFRLSGQLSELIVIGSGSCFPHNKIGTALAQAWETHYHPL